MPHVDSTGAEHRLVVELKLIGLPIIRAHHGPLDSIDQLDAHWKSPMAEIASSAEAS